MRLSLRLFANHVDTVTLENQLDNLPDQGITPPKFIYNLMQRAKANKQHIVLPEGKDSRILQAVASLRRHDGVNITQQGDPEEIKPLLYNLGLTSDLLARTLNLVGSPNGRFFHGTAQEKRPFALKSGVSLRQTADRALCHTHDTFCYSAG